MLECFAASNGLLIIISLLLILSEALGETKLVKSNGVMRFTFEAIYNILRLFKRVLTRH